MIVGDEEPGMTLYVYINLESELSVEKKLTTGLMTEGTSINTSPARIAGTASFSMSVICVACGLLLLLSLGI